MVHHMRDTEWDGVVRDGATLQVEAQDLWEEDDRNVGEIWGWVGLVGLTVRWRW